MGKRRQGRSHQAFRSTLLSLAVAMLQRLRIVPERTKSILAEMALDVIGSR
jgi:hypothetical protein